MQMRTRTSTLIGLLSIAAMVFMYACKKDGATGPIGPTGATGVANMSNSLDTVRPSAWGTGSGGIWSTGISDNNIISAAADMVLVYCSPGVALKTYHLLPFDYVVNPGDQLSNSVVDGNITLWYQSGPGGSTSTLPLGTLIIKIVVVPPAIKAAHPGTNWKNYNEVKQALNIQ